MKVYYFKDSRANREMVLNWLLDHNVRQVTNPMQYVTPYRLRVTEFYVTIEDDNLNAMFMLTFGADARIVDV